MKLNFALSGFDDMTDAMRIINLANRVIEGYNDNSITNGKYLSITYADNRKYNVALDASKYLVIIEKVE